jgi:peptide/nickel transport system substrate-binding protein
MRRRSLLLLASALVVAASLTLGPAATAGSERAAAGTVVFVHEQEPPNLQGPWVGNNLYATSMVINNIFYGGQVLDHNATYRLGLFESKPKVVRQRPLTVSFKFKKSAVWSDGRPVTGADFRATWQVYVNPANNVISRAGWEEIRSVTAKGKSVTVVFKTPYAAWESLVSGGPGVWPAHIIAGKNMNEMFQTSIPVSSGPWKFQSWQKGVQLTVVKNPRFRAGPQMKLDRVVFRYILDTNARFQSLKSGEGHVMEPQPQLQIQDFQRDSKFKVDTKPGYSYEHLDIQLGAQGHPALKLPYIRQALVTGINRTQIANTLYREIFPGMRPLQSLIFKPFEPGYQNHWKAWPFSQRKVIQILKGKGCTGGPDRPSAGNDDIFSCPNVGKLSFRYFTTTGNQLRALAFEIIQRQLKSVGIELVPRFQSAGLLFGTTLIARDWDLMWFGWNGSPSSSITAEDLYACGGEQNYMTYCNRRATRLLDRVSTTLDAGQRAQLINEAESKHLVKEIPSIPMFARPIFMISNKRVKGPVVNPTNEGGGWNVSTWRTTAG